MGWKSAFISYIPWPHRNNFGTQHGYLINYVTRCHCKRRELPSQSYGAPKKRNKILNIGLRTILYKTFPFSILN